MKHELKVVNEGSGSITQSYGVDSDAFEGMVTNITMELLHTAIFRGDTRSVSKCLMDVLNDLEPAEFGMEPKTPNDYMVLGMALARAIDIVDAMQEGIADKAKSRAGSLSGMTSMLHELAKRSAEKQSSIETKGSLN